MPKKNFAIIVATIIVVLGAVALLRRTKSEADIKIAVIPKGTTHSFWKAVHDGAKVAAKKHNKTAGDGKQVEIFWNGPNSENDRACEISIIEDMLTRNVDAFVLAPLDAKALVPVIEKVYKQKKPVIIIDSGVDTKSYDSFVATNNFKGGELAAEQMAKLLGGKGKLIIVKYISGSRSTEERERGFMETITKNHPGIKIAAHKFGGATVDSALAAAEDLLTKHPNINGVFASNESTSTGALRALDVRKLAGKVKMIGFDSSDYLFKSLKKESAHGLIVQNPKKMGRKGVELALAKLAGETVKDRIDTGVKLITKDNIPAK